MSFATNRYESLIAELLHIFEEYFEAEARINGRKLRLNPDAEDFYAELEEKLRANRDMRRLRSLEAGLVTLSFTDKRGGKDVCSFYLEAFRRADTGKGSVWTITINEPLVKER
jgi:hypothetical protein